MATEYDIQMGEQFGPLEVVEAGRLADGCPVKWWNRTLCRVNDSLVRIGVFEGEFHWHKHDREDEYFQVMEGKLLVDLEGRTVELGPRQGVMVPKGVLHRTRAKERTVVLMVEAATIVPTGDGAGASTRTASPARRGARAGRRARGKGTRAAAPAARGRARRGGARGA